MKKILTLALVLCGLFIGSLYAEAVVHVNGYYRSNGTYVAPHYRSDPDGIKSNNWSYPGNTNPYTGKTAGGTVDSYLNSYSYPSYTLPSYTPTYTPSTYIPTYYIPSYSNYTDTTSHESIKGGYRSHGVVFCDDNYYESGDKCLKAPKHGTAGLDDFYCDYGYEKSGNKCLTTEEISKKKTQKLLTKKLKCEKKDENVWYDNSCYKKLDICQDSFGSHSTYFSGNTADDIKCSCEVGYEFSTVGEKSCVKSK